jgi:SAM-dependent methyltransferase
MVDPDTLEAYNKNGPSLAAYFSGVGARTHLINEGLALVQDPSLTGDPTAARVVEMGCGSGRDAAEIIPRVSWYQGVDPAAGMLDLARQSVPDAPSDAFVQADALSYNYPQGLDVVFAFASFLHLRRDEFRVACQRVHAALRVGGVLFMTLKARAEYQEEWVEDQFGKRLFFYYPEKLVRELAGEFSFPYAEHEAIGKTNWLLLGMRKEAD